MKTLKTLALSLAFLLGTLGVSNAALPWGSTGPLQVSGATPTCTYTTTALSCIENMTANVTSITLAGMTAGKYYTIILMQDGTGSRTLTQTSITGAPALSTTESAANGYAAWVILATSASAASFVTDYDNPPLWDVFLQSQAINTVTAAATTTTAGAPTIVFPGMSASHRCFCVPTTVTVGGVPMVCVATTNVATCEFANAGAGTPSEASITALVTGAP